jgi:drug/metabolite transporter (DMT)-like permease
VYALWLFLLQGPVIPLIAWRRRGRYLVAGLRPYWRKGALGGVLSLASYGTVVFAQAHAPLAAVATLRETSIVFAALIGRLLFAEPYGRRRAAASVVVAAGIVALSLG